MNAIQNIKFSINNWAHLYSLQQAILYNEQLTGNALSIKGRILKSAFLSNTDTPISIEFIQTDTVPAYPLINNQLHELGLIKLQNKNLHTRITVDKKIFEELRKNLIEYADIEGIHIVVTLGLLSAEKTWQENQNLQIVELDYAMKGDA